VGHSLRWVQGRRVSHLTFLGRMVISSSVSGESSFPQACPGLNTLSSLIVVESA